MKNQDNFDHAVENLKYPEFPLEMIIISRVIETEFNLHIKLNNSVYQSIRWPNFTSGELGTWFSEKLIV